MGRKLFAYLLVIVMLLGTFIPVVARVPDRSENSGQMVDVIVDTGAQGDDVIKDIEKLGGKISHKFENITALAVSIPVSSLDNLTQLTGIDSIYRDNLITLDKPAEGDGFTPYSNGENGILAGDAMSSALEDLPATYSSYLPGKTGAQLVWPETFAGASSIVAVVDTGTDASHLCLSGRVIAGPDFSADDGTAYEGSTATTNSNHGTFVSGIIAANCALPLPIGNPLREAVLAHSSANLFPYPIPGVDLLPIQGIAPAANIYAVKVFPHTGGGSPTSVILKGIDHVITLKRTGAMDIDVLNLSLGGTALFDGRDLEDKLIDAATDAGIVVVASASNDGPAPSTAESPATAYSSISVGALSDKAHTRVATEVYVGELTGNPGLGRLAAYQLYPEAFGDLRVADFSSRGPTADGRAYPDITAIGIGNFSLAIGNNFAFANGTSFSTAEVSGAAALLQTWNEINGDEFSSISIRNALIEGAVSIGDDWSEMDQGKGYLNVPNALNLLKQGDVTDTLKRNSSEKLNPNIKFNKIGVFEDSIVGLEPSRTVDYIFSVDESTEKVTIEVFNAVIPPSQFPLPYNDAYEGNSFEFYVKTQRSGPGYIFNSANVYGNFKVEIVDGKAEVIYGLVGEPVDAVKPLQPGLWKVTLEADWTSSAAMSADIRITKDVVKTPKSSPTFRGTVRDGEKDFYALIIQPGTSKAVFDLVWIHNWSKYPTNDLDLIVSRFDAYGNPAELFFGGATLNSPERLTLLNPIPGIYGLAVEGYEVWHGCDVGTSPTSMECVESGREPYQIWVTIEQ